MFFLFGCFVCVGVVFCCGDVFEALACFECGCRLVLLLLGCCFCLCWCGSRVFVCVGVAFVFVLCVVRCWFCCACLFCVMLSCGIARARVLLFCPGWVIRLCSVVFFLFCVCVVVALVWRLRWCCVCFGVVCFVVCCA